MKIEIYCNECGTLDVIEKEEEEVSETNQSDLAIPIPNIGNGLTTYSLVHSDHTLIVDIDHEGNVRGERAIQRIGQEIENILAAISQKILNYVEEVTDDAISFVVITRDVQLRKMLLGVFQQLLINIDGDRDGLLSISKNEALLEIGSLTVWVGGWDDKIYSILPETTSIVYQVNQANMLEVTEMIDRNFRQKPRANYVLLYERDFLNTLLAKEMVKDLIMQIPGLQILDIDSSIKTAISIFHVVDTLIREKLTSIKPSN